MSTNPLAAIEPTHNAVVHAAAGTGKTWLLVSRIIRLLLAGAAPGSILAITFTRKAAAEMRLRLGQRLLEMCEAGDARLQEMLREIGAPADTAACECARGLYEQLLAGPHELRATTFHAFCQELLQRFAFEAGAPPAFEVIEQTAELEAAARRALDRDLADSDGPVAAALDRLMQDCGGPANVYRALSAFLAKRSDWWAYTEQAPDPVSDAAERLRHALGIDPSADPLEAFARESGVRALLQSLTTALARDTPPSLQPMLQSLEAAGATNSAADFYRFVSHALLRKDEAPRAFRPTNAQAQALGALDTDALVAAHRALLDRLMDARERRRRHGTWRRTRDWYVVGARLLEHFQDAKRAHGLLDFADLEWLAYRLLTGSRHAEWVQYKLDQRIDHLLIDEFQDTNPTQWRLVLPLLEEMAAGQTGRARSAFLVGDEKQSIYRFRRADPALLHAARAWLQRHTAAGSYEQRISWRSSPAVIRFVNLLFDTGGAAPDGYALPGFRPHDTHHPDLWGRAELLPLIGRDPEPAAAAGFRNPLERPRLIAEDLRHGREGRTVAQRIKELLGRPLADAGGVRPLRYGDVLILLRDRVHAAAYEAALRDAGIPYVGAGRGAFVECLEVRDLIHLLGLLIAPFDDVALASVLRSPIFAASDGDLLALAEIEGATWFERLVARYRGDESNAPLARAARLIPAWRAAADRVPVHDLLDRIYFDGALPERYARAAPPHLRRRAGANLQRLLDLALDLDSGRFPSLARFLDRLELLTREENEALGGGQEPDDQVRILTIHGAKGLEAPVVFVVDAARAPAARERGPGALIEWPLEAAGPRQFILAPRKQEADALSRDALEREARAAAQEESNLLYVALTRAKQMLFISGCEPRTDGRNGGGAGDAARGWYGYIERRLQAIAERGGAEALGLALEPIAAPDGAGRYNLCGHIAFGSPPARVDDRAPPAPAPVAIDPALTKPFDALREVAAPVLPSLAAFESEDAEPERLATAARAAPAVQRGVVIHRMLERLTAAPAERERARDSVRREFAAVLDDKQLARYWDEASAVIAAQAFRAFFDPRLYKEARNEVSVLYRVDGRSVAGVIDRLVIRDNGLVLIDYKTHRVTAAQVPPLIQLYTPQLQLYAEGLRRLWPGRPVEAVLLFTACRHAVAVDVG